MARQVHESTVWDCHCAVEWIDRLLEEQRQKVSVVSHCSHISSAYTKLLHEIKPKPKTNLYVSMRSWISNRSIALKIRDQIPTFIRLFFVWKVLLIKKLLLRPHPRVSKPPQTLDELGESLALWEQLNGDQSKIEANFQPLYDQLKKKKHIFLYRFFAFILGSPNPLRP